MNVIFWGIGNPSSDFCGGDRMGANLYTDSLIALDADTGKLKWYFQETPHDLWDYDSNPEPVLFDVTQNGATQGVVDSHSSKNGYAYLYNPASPANSSALSPTRTPSIGPRASIKTASRSNP